MPQLSNVSYRKVFSYNKIENPILKGLSYICSIFHVIYIVAKMRPDVVHIQWWRLWCVDYVALFLYRLFAHQVVYTAHNLLPHDSGRKYIRQSQLYYNRVDKIIVHAQSTRQELIDQFHIASSKVYVAPHGVIAPHCDQAKVDMIMQQLREQHDLNNRLVFSALGLQNPYKGTPLLRQALLSSTMLKNNPRVFIFIVGKGDIIRPCDFEDYHNVKVVNLFVEAEYMQAVTRLTNVLLLPYQRISQSGILLSALQYHIPYLATPVGGLTEPLAYGDIGWTLREQTSAQLREAIESLSLNSSEVLEKKNNSKAWSNVLQHYDWQHIATLTMQCYQEKAQ